MAILWLLKINHQSCVCLRLHTGLAVVDPYPKFGNTTLLVLSRQTAALSSRTTAGMLTTEALSRNGVYSLVHSPLVYRCFLSVTG